MLRFRSLGSGSTGNATLIEASGSSGATPRPLLMDCGFGIRQSAALLGRARLGYGDIDDIFITHEHSDHVGCVQAFAVRHRVPVWMSDGTYDAIGTGFRRPAAPSARRRDDRLLWRLRGPALHRAARCAPAAAPGVRRRRRPPGPANRPGPCAGRRAGATGRLPGALLLESNHDSELLANGPYPHFLKRRVGGAYGYLSNAASADLARAVQHVGLRRVVAAHLSERNNRPELAQTALAAALGWETVQVNVASAAMGTDWFVV
ncbi:MBL fold metallo-hydrolase [Xylophilus sp.]|uniref:MBL fold metallo-hydrolase n=1 Tax=Xylophilus sp. TaxID=2653893 RepID=UPI0013BDF27F|nr:MBL fold metallo-hydrolase [Xylophilus sp.]KAF1049116.1 MAG: putative metallo-hydrolase YycJ [Xylophilus sp.]